MTSPVGFDEKFGRTPHRYLLQCTVAGAITMAFLSMVDLLTHIGLVAALGATTFLVFTMPHKVSSRPRYVIGGYVMGVIAGVLTDFAFGSPHALVPISQMFVLGAIAVGVASLLMVTTDTEHPPAAGLALGLVLQDWDFYSVLYVMGCVCFLSVAKRLLKRFLIDLV
jgi:CBS-domain-containing membrane protein